MFALGSRRIAPAFVANSRRAFSALPETMKVRASILYYPE